MKNLTVADMMTARVVVARAAMPLKEAASVLATHHISALPVLDPDDRLVGMVSERDLLAKQAHPLPEPVRWWQRRRTRREIRRAAGDTVGHVMTTDPVTIAPNLPLAEAARRMTDHELKHLPVIDDKGALVGIVSRADLLGAFLRTDEEIRSAVLDEVFVHLLWADPTELDVSVTDGIVSMAGTVEERSTAELAEQLVHRLDGVIDVISRLEYRIDDGGIGRRPRPQTAGPAIPETPQLSAPTTRSTP
jgi:CBS domain-containing protein